MHPLELKLLVAEFARKKLLYHPEPRVILEDFHCSQTKASTEPSVKGVPQLSVVSFALPRQALLSKNDTLAVSKA